MQLGINTQETCNLCPRRCGADRTQSKGFCGATDSLEVASVCVHRGEEPPLNPIVNVFFAHCNLQCVYCQNYQISGQCTVTDDLCAESASTLADRICQQLNTEHLTTSTPLIGLVTAAHYVTHIPLIIDELHSRGLHPTVVYNSSGYESVETLRSLEGLIDIYLPDFKYMDPLLAKAYSHASDYPEVATAALREMIRQVGLGLKTDENGTAYRGLIVRHLVLPGAVENSLAVLNPLAQLATDHWPLAALHLSLMAQYFPPRPGLTSPLDRTVTPEEYRTVVSRAEELGLTDGWIQELTAQDNYRPDFTQTNPFPAL